MLARTELKRNTVCRVREIAARSGRRRYAKWKCRAADSKLARSLRSFGAERFHGRVAERCVRKEEQRRDCKNYSLAIVGRTGLGAARCFPAAALVPSNAALPLAFPRFRRSSYITLAITHCPADSASRPSVTRRAREIARSSRCSNETRDPPVARGFARGLARRLNEFRSPYYVAFRPRQRNAATLPVRRMRPEI